MPNSPLLFDDSGGGVGDWGFDSVWGHPKIVRAWRELALSGCHRACMSHRARPVEPRTGGQEDTLGY
jgi:hypothetical protein